MKGERRSQAARISNVFCVECGENGKNKTFFLLACEEQKREKAYDILTACNLENTDLLVEGIKPEVHGTSQGQRYSAEKKRTQIVARSQEDNSIDLKT